MLVNQMQQNLLHPLENQDTTKNQTEKHNAKLSVTLSARFMLSSRHIVIAEITACGHVMLNGSVSTLYVHAFILIMCSANKQMRMKN